MGKKEKHSRSLEEEDPPVSCAQVEDVWSLAIIAGAGSQGVVDADSILQLCLGKSLPRLILLLWGCPSRPAPVLAWPSPAT
jgi:hypothetical protein